MTMVTERVIYPGNDFVVERAISLRAVATGQDTSATGLAGVIGFLSATRGGTPIHASLQVTLAERGSVSGQYYGVLQGTDLSTHLTATYDETMIWECVQAGTDYKQYVALRVRLARIGG